MKGYVDLLLLPLPKKNLAKYRRQAQWFGRMARKYGVLDYREFIGDDLFIKGVQSFTKKVTLKIGDLVIAAVTDFKSRKHRDTVMKKMFEDPRTNAMMKSEPLFSTRQMAYGGFKTLVRIR